jgi:hypothetical protein
MPIRAGKIHSMHKSGSFVGSTAMNRGTMNHPAANVPRQPQPKMLDEVRVKIRTMHYSRRTEEAYIKSRLTVSPGRLTQERGAS